MNINNLCVGQIYKNYRDLCTVLEQPVKSGCSKNSQINKWGRFFDYERVGNAYIIRKIYEVDPEEDFLLNLSHNKVCLVLLAGYIHSQLPSAAVNTITLRRRDLDDIMGLVNTRFISMQDSLKLTDSEKEFFTEVKYRNSRFTDRVLDLFSDLQKDPERPYCKITTGLRYRTADMPFGTFVAASPDLELEISKVFYDLLGKYEAEHKGTLYIRGQIKEFYKRYNWELQRRWGIVYSEATISFLTCKGLLEHLVHYAIADTNVLIKLHHKANKDQIGKLLREYDGLFRKYTELKETDHEGFKTETYRDLPQEIYEEKLKLVDKFIHVLDGEFKQIFAKTGELKYAN